MHSFEYHTYVRPYIHTHTFSCYQSLRYSHLSHRRPLFKPCKCSGSIGLTHQDCLESWLKVQRADGRCELCKTKFRFAPQYATNTPDKLSTWQVTYSIFRRAVVRWLPFFMRSLFCAALWLLVAPLMTSYLYHGWMHRPAAILERLHWSLVPGDLVSGAVVAAIVIVSFLSLMSFADFLRVEWLNQRGLWGPQPPANGPRGANAAQQRARGGAAGLGGGGGGGGLPPRGAVVGGGGGAAAVLDGLPLGADLPHDNVDDSIWDHFQQRIVAQPPARVGRALHHPRLRQMAAWERGLDQEYRGIDQGADDGNEEVIVELDANHHDNGDNDVAADESEEEQEAGGSDSEEEDEDDANDDDDDDDDDDESWSEEDEDDDDDDDDDDDLPPLVPNVFDRFPVNPNNEARLRLQRNENGRFDAAPFDMDGIGPDEPVDMDLNIALDELLGVRGPLGGVVRNLLWLLAFNTVYLGFFAFTPRVLGSAIITLCFNTTSTSDPGSNATSTEVATEESRGLLGILKSIDEESRQQNTTFRLPDLATVTLGYLSCALAVLFMRALWALSQKIRFFRVGGRRTDEGTENHDLDEMREALDEMHRIVHGMGHDMPGLGDEPPGVEVSVAIGVALDGMMASVKVGVLLFLKMFMLPIVLGICLDGSTMSLFGSNLDARISSAGQDLFSFILLHWVAGITFMLLVTVSVLQLREVAHPDLLGQMIRPQEPQPDLLGNLMHESIGTHTKRMILSLIIYAALLTMHVYIPVRVLEASGATKYFPFLELKFWYPVMPHLQVPLELLLFHLSMLALLEKYKNSIGEMQHHWLKFMAHHMGLTNCLIPQKVQCFHLLGSRPVFQRGRTVDQFWSDLAKTETDGEVMLESDLESFAPEPVDLEMIGETKPSGERVLFFGSDFIRLPVRLPGRALRTRSFLLATKIGRFRLDARGDMASPVIQLWEEVPGDLIPRPPEGWDDLGAGGADVQGRWAWGQEKKSAIEGGVARRTKLLGKRQSVLKSLFVSLQLTMIALLSWVATTSLLGFVLASPLAIGRFIYFIFRVPERWIHDPLAFLIGSIFFFPFVRGFARNVLMVDVAGSRRLGRWIGSFHLPSTPKVMVLVVTAVVWFGLAPFLLGVTYDIAFLKTTSWFMGQEPWIDRKAALLSWAAGSFLLYLWSDACQAGVLTRPFWNFAVGGGDEAAGAAAAAAAGQEEHPADAQAAAWIATGDNRLRLTWQGKHGRMAQFWGVWRAVWFNWEWDKVDLVVLLQDCAMPVTVELFWILFCPLACLAVCVFYLEPVQGLARVVFVRTILGVACMAQVGRVWSDQLKTWFQVVHRTARDDRYLIGQILINHGQAE
jgi:E3 ubiquitin-protein ligase MARCH6